jgi:hypothetical protein
LGRNKKGLDWTIIPEKALLTIMVWWNVLMRNLFNEGCARLGILFKVDSRFFRHFTAGFISGCILANYRLKISPKWGTHFL